ncbi:hypothetical protein DACRYDRAFT_24638 [Dacryopinax primogenitus]|uniref:Uncharacterized protein n=1 Tax=Dacryopinax primogenitus (strain DJM 731) TaxID=1858805 RepID=M5FP04_DACPD|nr:uncharacterized protein DACRYDRAFT_24638 [Dacryopinax primogenitus]EJT98120.1 hypothetical protein DACRYDRAFT_24638 [Dacryopinax primogenitus]
MVKWELDKKEAKMYPLTRNIALDNTPDCPGLWQCLEELQSAENVVAWAEPQFIRHGPWAVSTFTEDILDLFKGFINATERPYLSHVR